MVCRLIVTDGVRPAVLGVAVGMGLAWLGTRFLQSLLHGVGPHDLLVFGGVPLLMFVLGVAASLPPAWRASQSPPARLLRQE